MIRDSELSADKRPDPHHDTYSKTVFGFWLFLLSDFILFGTIFATYSVIGYGDMDNASTYKLFNLDFALFQTFLMLLSSTMAGLGGASAFRKDKKMTLIFFGLTFLLSIIFMGFEIADFQRLIASGNSWQKNAVLSIFFTILATHGLHVLLGLIWIPCLLYPVWKEGIGHLSLQRLTCLKLFFQFLNIVWVFIFTLVYFMNGGSI